MSRVKVLNISGKDVHCNGHVFRNAVFDSNNYVLGHGYIIQSQNAFLEGNLIGLNPVLSDALAFASGGEFYEMMCCIKGLADRFEIEGYRQLQIFYDMCCDSDVASVYGGDPLDIPASLVEWALYSGSEFGLSPVSHNEWLFRAFLKCGFDNIRMGGLNIDWVEKSLFAEGSFEKRHCRLIDIGGVWHFAYRCPENGVRSGMWLLRMEPGFSFVEVEPDFVYNL